MGSKSGWVSTSSPSWLVKTNSRSPWRISCESLNNFTSSVTGPWSVWTVPLAGFPSADRSASTTHRGWKLEINDAASSCTASMNTFALVDDWAMRSTTPLAASGPARYPAMKRNSYRFHWLVNSNSGLTTSGSFSQFKGRVQNRKPSRAPGVSLRA